MDGIKYYDHNWNEIETPDESKPYADAVVHGKWKPIDLTWGRSYYYCDNCGETVDMPTTMGVPMFRFCPNCGADMKGESDG